MVHIDMNVQSMGFLNHSGKGIEDYEEKDSNGSNVFLFLIVGFLTIAARAGCIRERAYHLLEGTGWKSVYVNQASEDGPVIYLVSGIHGNEPAGWKAAEKIGETGIWMREHSIWSDRSMPGEQQKNERCTKETRDINRNFPGDADGWDAERIADAVYQDIAKIQPDLVLDLHEAEEKRGRDLLADSLICESLEETGELILTMLEESGKEESSLPKLTLYGSPPPGSINRVVAETLGIPVITLETDRSEKLETRIYKQNSIVEYILKSYGILKKFQDEGGKTAYMNSENKHPGSPGVC